MSKIIICGDIHARWDKLNSLINKKQPDIILQVGDFGYYPEYKNYHPHHIKNGDTKIYWCDGNHENHDKLNIIKRNEIRPNVFYMKRGSVLTLPNGEIVLFMGGAESIDKHLRTIGVDWFPQEVISQKDLENLPSTDTKIDIVISHTCPLEFDLGDRFKDTQKYKDCSRVALSRVLEIYKPAKWYFGHYHANIKGQYDNCKWECLNMASNTGWWKWLYKY